MKKLWALLSGAMSKMGSSRALPQAGGLVGDRRGAVYVEFLAVFFPILTMFMCLVQFTFLQTAAIIVQHAAMRGVRVASVTLYDDPDFFGGDAQGAATEKRLAPAKEAAKIPLVALGSASGAVVNVDKQSYGRNDMVKMTVQYNYKCLVPLGRTFVCGLSSQKTLNGEASMPSQGAEFIY